jgi:hypothetical protein
MAQTMPISATQQALQGEAISGQAITLATTMVRLRPQLDGEVIQRLPAGMVVTLIGKHYNLWVRVQTDQAVLAGWVLATDLEQYHASPSDAPDPTASPLALPGVPGLAAPTGTAQPLVPTNPIPTPIGAPAGTSQRWRVRELAPVLPSEVLPPALQTRIITVTVGRTAVNLPQPTRIAGVRATPIPQRPMAGLRIVLVNAFGDRIAEAITPASGVVVLNQLLPATTHLWVQIPALGLHVPVTHDLVDILLMEES